MSVTTDMARRGEDRKGRGNRGAKGTPLTNCVPYRGVSIRKPWQGLSKKKPWFNECTIVIPHLDTSELLDTCIESWKQQTVKSNIIVVDTGSSPRHMGVVDELELYHKEVEVHRLRFKAVKHPSDPVAIAMDLAFSLCSTRFLFATHADCFPARNDLVEWMISCRESSGCPVVGYQITDRKGIDTDGWVGHTATLFDMVEADNLNLAWSQRKLCNLTGMDHFGNNRCNGYPDTEFLINEQLDRAGVERNIIGKEVNYETTDDKNILHVRSYSSSKLYSPEHHKKASMDMSQALSKTHERLIKWKSLKKSS